MSDGLMSKDSFKNFLYVEGPDDQAVFRSLLGYYNIFDPYKSVNRFENKNEQFEIKVPGNKQEVLKVLKVALKGSNTQRFGAVVDADTDLSQTWDSFSNILRNAGYRGVPRVPDPFGTIIKQETLPTVGVWLMPDNQIPGMMEDFISFLRPIDDIFWSMAEDVVQKVIEKGPLFRPTYKSKACLHTWLAWQEEPGKPMGQAITKRFVDATSIHVQQLISWFCQLFEIEVPSKESQAKPK